MAYETLNSKKSQQAYKTISDYKAQRRVRVGYNETVKAITNNSALLVIIARDAEPACLVDPLPVLCEQKGVHFAFVESKAAIGKACGMDVGVLACALLSAEDENSGLLPKEISQILK